MVLMVYNTLTKKKEEFIPLKEKEVRMYTCGVTVYDYCHVGHARPAIVFDVIRRYLEFKGYKVKHIVNFTDVDDKMINRAKEEGTTIFKLAERIIESYFKDMDALRVKRADYYPRATEHIKEMVALIKGLLDKGYAYEIDGNVYFQVNKFPPYGRLSGRSLEEMLAGARVEVDERKRDPLDFALWKAAKEGEPWWESPWGKGRPGWHIECSAMSMKYLGETFDIHGGGMDLVFPHHENEIAQSESFTGKPFVKYWLHNGFITINQEKMSKSLGNVSNLRDLFQRYEPQVLRFFLLSTHYRSPLDLSEEGLKAAKEGLERFRGALEIIDFHLGPLKEKGENGVAASSELLSFGEEIKVEGLNKKEKELSDRIGATQKGFVEAMDDDFNTALALANLFGLIRELNIFLSDREFKLTEKGISLLYLAKRTLLTLGGVLGLSRGELAPSAKEEVLIAGLLNLVIRLREEAREKKDWATADRIRGELLSLGIILEDTPQGTRWKWK